MEEHQLVRYVVYLELTFPLENNYMIVTESDETITEYVLLMHQYTLGHLKLK